MSSMIVRVWERSGVLWALGSKWPSFEGQAKLAEGDPPPERMEFTVAHMEYVSDPDGGEHVEVFGQPLPKIFKPATLKDPQNFRTAQELMKVLLKGGSLTSDQKKLLDSLTYVNPAFEHQHGIVATVNASEILRYEETMSLEDIKSRIEDLQDDEDDEGEDDGAAAGDNGGSNSTEAAES